MGGDTAHEGRRQDQLGLAVEEHIRGGLQVAEVAALDERRATESEVQVLRRLTEIVQCSQTPPQEHPGLLALGVTSAAKGNSSAVSARTAVGCSNRAPLVAIITGSTTNGGRPTDRNQRATTRMIAMLNSIPVFTTAGWKLRESAPTAGPPGSGWRPDC